MQIKWTELASTDLDEIENYITQDNHFSVAVDVILRIIDSANLILTSMPYAGRIGRVMNTRELILDGLPYTVVYRVKLENTIEILRVLHHAQDWPLEFT